VRRRPLSIVLALLAAAGCGGAPASLPAPAPARSIAVAPDFAGTVWAITPRGLMRSRSGGHDWRPVPGGGQARAVAFADQYAVVAGAAGTRVGPFAGTWLSRPRQAPGRFVALASPYHTTDRVYALDVLGRLWLSVREARGWVRLRAAGLPAGVAALAARRGDPLRPDTVFAAAGAGGLWRSDDFGATFRRVPAVMVATGVATTTADPRRVLVAAPRLLLSTDDGASFRPVGPAVDAVAFDPRNWRVAFATAGERLLRSADGGATWSG
jgi:hypothetical protein